MKKVGSANRIGHSTTFKIDGIQHEVAIMLLDDKKSFRLDFSKFDEENVVKKTTSLKVSTKAMMGLAYLMTANHGKMLVGGELNNEE